VVAVAAASTSTFHPPTYHRPGPYLELGNLHLNVDPTWFSYQYTSLHNGTIVRARIFRKQYDPAEVTRSALNATFAKWENTRAPMGTYTNAECIILYSRRRQRVNNQLVYYYRRRRRRRHYIPERLLYYCLRARVLCYIPIPYCICVNAYSIIIIVKGRWHIYILLLLLLYCWKNRGWRNLQYERGNNNNMISGGEHSTTIYYIHTIGI